MTTNNMSPIVSRRFSSSSVVRSRGIYPAALHRKHNMKEDYPARSYEIVAKRNDGSVFIGQDRAPAIPLFENAFSAFAQGCLVMTEKGEVAVEDLQPGERIVKADGTSAPLIWIGSSSFVLAGSGKRTPLVRVMEDSLGAGRPSSFITFGPTARVLHTPLHMRADESNQEVFTLMRDLVDGVNIIEVTPPTPVRLYHLCLEQHSAIMVGGLHVETYHPGDNLMTEMPIRHRDQFLGMFPHIISEKDFGSLCYPRVPNKAQTLM